MFGGPPKRPGGANGGPFGPGPIRLGGAPIVPGGPIGPPQFGLLKFGGGLNPPGGGFLGGGPPLPNIGGGGPPRPPLNGGPPGP